MSPVSARGIWSPLVWRQAVVDAAPTDVRNHYIAYRTAVAQFEDAAGAAESARRSLAAVDQDDKVAAMDAIEQGSKVPPSMRAARESTVSAAKTLEDATRGLAVKAERALIAACGAAQADWEQRALKDAQNAHQKAHEALDRAAALCADASAVTGLLSWLSLGAFDRPPSAGVIDVARPLGEVHKALEAESPDLVFERIEARRRPPEPGPRATGDGIVLDAAAAIAGVR